MRNWLSLDFERGLAGEFLQRRDAVLLGIRDCPGHGRGETSVADQRIGQRKRGGGVGMHLFNAEGLLREKISHFVIASRCSYICYVHSNSKTSSGVRMKRYESSFCHRSLRTLLGE